MAYVTIMLSRDSEAFLELLGAHSRQTQEEAGKLWDNAFETLTILDTSRVRCNQRTWLPLLVPTLALLLTLTLASLPLAPQAHRGAVLNALQLIGVEAVFHILLVRK